MPIYEYQCPACGKFEVIQRFSDEPVKKNPDCTREDCPCAAQRLVSRSAFHLKGGGWYKDGYSGSTAPASGGSSGSSGASSEGGSSGGGDSSSSTASSGESGSSEGAKKGCGTSCACHS